MVGLVEGIITDQDRQGSVDDGWKNKPGSGEKDHHHVDIWRLPTDDAEIVTKETCILNHKLKDNIPNLLRCLERLSSFTSFNKWGQILFSKFTANKANINVYLTWVPYSNRYSMKERQFLTWILSVDDDLSPVDELEELFSQLCRSEAIITAAN